MMDKLEKLMQLNRLKSLKKPEPAIEDTIVTDDVGNKYKQEVDAKGIRLVLVESYNGELFE